MTKKVIYKSQIGSIYAFYIEYRKISPDLIGGILFEIANFNIKFHGNSVATSNKCRIYVNKLYINIFTYTKISSVI